MSHRTPTIHQLISFYFLPLTRPPYMHYNVTFVFLLSNSVTTFQNIATTLKVLNISFWVHKNCDNYDEEDRMREGWCPLDEINY